jgi:transcriptional regulator GlxA family with amidase domain
MSRQLKQIADWSERAAAAQWCVNILALTCGVSLSQLERHFHEAWGQCPRGWLHAERMRRACELLERRERIKEIAAALHYVCARNFTRAFTEHLGYNPREHLKRRTPNAELDSVAKRRRGKKIRDEK